MRRWFTCRRHKPLYIALPILFILATYHIIASTYIITDIGYLARPLWDNVQEQWDIIQHYTTEGLSLERTCQLHGWSINNETKPKMIDAVIFSVELDLYEVRLRELWNVVDKFIILESNATFTGKPKPFVFADNAERFAFAKEKLVYARVNQQPLPPHEGPFYNEAAMRVAMNENIEKVANDGDFIIMSDVDEIPRASTLRTLKACSGVPSPLHLQLRNYIYSYEFPLDLNSWRARVERYSKGVTAYSHGQQSRNLLADAGWHCSFCFRTIKEFVFKMTSYSHADRVRGDQFLSKDHIQNVICTGQDIFGMYPEAYSYKELIAKWDGAPKSDSAVGLPKAVLEDDRFSFLLPGGCERQLE
ncbi:hypothetical protein K450DRAFT_248530 [Umbelopsis ramanniana AG]|uniref:Beta-1,4-mannosyl-glycoprotein 4-beta-N-acetylglucosaminyltransferase n=1 Tax=Umbelopsis ramanniana AG TaxID=1314678 RepID=A0AAD5E7D4_UMBRA|nr:uncharacterized protein K450DRAFT_248530 [Umbelopsis ramanniana AG]KAI8578184.1 hypothetical protein K450DRAFT_248530 [Umbelopsis ramanniana AG]